MSTLLLSLVLLAGPEKPFAITVVDEATGRGVPLIELRTTNHLRFFTDSAGVVAFHEPELMGKEVYFAVSGHGYEYPKDGFGFRGVRLTPKAGGGATVKVKRVNVAERLYRVTGDGIYAECRKAGLAPPFDPTTKNGRVVGCDSVIAVRYKVKLFWIWGDTTQAKYPLGNFDVTAATSPPPGKDGTDPDRGVVFTYFGDGKGFVKGVAPMPGKGPTWIESLVVLPGKDGRERLWAAFVKVEGLKVYARGLAVFDDEKQVFEKAADLPVDPPVRPDWHAFRHTEGGVEYLYFGHPFPLVRVPATEEAYTDLSKYEAYTCLREGSTFEAPKVDRDENGKARYAWRKNAPPVDPSAQAKFEKQGVLKESEVLLPIRDRDSGRRVVLHNGTVNWNAYRKKWVLIANEIGGKPSHLGEVWFAEADTPTGPWRDAVKVVTHDRMDFYNPKHHAFFDRDGGRVIYFEGTYVNTFSGNPDATPRYDYNQVMYKLDLSDPRLAAKPGK